MIPKGGRDPNETIGTRKPPNLLLLVVALAGVALGLALLVQHHVRSQATSHGMGGGKDADPSIAKSLPSNNPVPGFRNETQAAGLDFRMQFLPGEQGEDFKINLYDHGCGVVVGDLNGDGNDDIYFLNQLGPNALYLNRGDGTFVEATAESGPLALDDRVCAGATCGDYDNDGDQDLYVTSTRGGNVLFQNDGYGHFVDITERAGLRHVAHPQTAAFFDFDGDADLDLLVLNSGQWTTNDFHDTQRYFAGVATLAELAASPPEYNLLYMNNGDGTFSDVSAGSGLHGIGWGGDVAIFDFDEDGRMDVLLTSMFNRQQLFHNEGDGTFVDVARPVLRRIPFGAAGAKAFDFNNDGRLDVYIVAMHSDMWMESPDFDVSTVAETKSIHRFSARG
jgi:hypothetical protein